MFDNSVQRDSYGELRLRSRHRLESDTPSPNNGQGDEPSMDDGGKGVNVAAYNCENSTPQPWLAPHLNA
jgi:hypothetical protein